MKVSESQSTRCERQCTKQQGSCAVCLQEMLMGWLPCVFPHSLHGSQLPLLCTLHRWLAPVGTLSNLLSIPFPLQGWFCLDSPFCGWCALCH